MAYKRDYNEYGEWEFDDDGVYYDEELRRPARQKSRMST